MQLTLKWSKINIHWKELHGFDHDKEIQGESIERQGAFQSQNWPLDHGRTSQIAAFSMSLFRCVKKTTSFVHTI